MALVLEIHHIHVKRGDCTVILVKDCIVNDDKINLQEFRYVNKVLIDGGDSSWQEDNGETQNQLLAYLQKYIPNGKDMGENDLLSNKFNLYIATHYHQDHLKGFYESKIECDFIMDIGRYDKVDKKDYENNLHIHYKSCNDFNDVGKYFGDSYCKHAARLLNSATKRIDIPFINSENFEEIDKKYINSKNWPVQLCLSQQNLGLEIPNDSGLCQTSPEIQPPDHENIYLTCYAANGILANGTDLLNKTSNPNDHCLSFLLTWNGFRYFIAGDLSACTEGKYTAITPALSEYLRNFPLANLDVTNNINLISENGLDVMKVSHHGSPSNSYTELYKDEFKPSIMVIPANDHLSSGLPEVSVLKMLYRYCVKDQIDDPLDKKHLYLINDVKADRYQKQTMRDIADKASKGKFFSNIIGGTDEDKDRYTDVVESITFFMPAPQYPILQFNEKEYKEGDKERVNLKKIKSPSNNATNYYIVEKFGEIDPTPIDRYASIPKHVEFYEFIYKKDNHYSKLSLDVLRNSLNIPKKQNQKKNQKKRKQEETTFKEEEKALYESYEYYLTPSVILQGLLLQSYKIFSWLYQDHKNETSMGQVYIIKNFPYLSIDDLSKQLDSVIARDEITNLLDPKDDSTIIDQLVEILRGFDTEALYEDIFQYLTNEKLVNKAVLSKIERYFSDKFSSNNDIALLIKPTFINFSALTLAIFVREKSTSCLGNFYQNNEETAYRLDTPAMRKTVKNLLENNINQQIYAQLTEIGMEEDEAKEPHLVNISIDKIIRTFDKRNITKTLLDMRKQTLNKKHKRKENSDLVMSQDDIDNQKKIKRKKINHKDEIPEYMKLNNY